MSYFARQIGASDIPLVSAMVDAATRAAPCAQRLLRSRTTEKTERKHKTDTPENLPAPFAVLRVARDTPHYKQTLQRLGAQQVVGVLRDRAQLSAPHEDDTFITLRCLRCPIVRAKQGRPYPIAFIAPLRAMLAAAGRQTDGGLMAWRPEEWHRNPHAAAAKGSKHPSVRARQDQPCPVFCQCAACAPQKSRSDRRTPMLGVGEGISPPAT
jgi:hypothetical protein